MNLPLLHPEFFLRRLFILLSIGMLLTSCSRTSPEAERNEERIGQVRIGMKWNDVVGILGPPRSVVIHVQNDQTLDLVYTAPPA